MDLRAFINSKNNINQAFWIGIGGLSTFGIVIVTAAILSRYLSKPEYGTYRQILYVYNTLLVVFSAGLPRIFAYFLPRFSLNQGKEIVLRITKFLFLTGLLFSVFIFSFSGLIASVLKNPELSVGLKYFSPVPTLLLPTLGLEGIFTTYKKTIYIAMYNTITRIIMLIFIVGPVIFISNNYITAIYGWIISSLVIFAIAYYFKSIPFKGIRQEKSNLSLKEIFGYSLPLVSATIAGTIYRAANQFYISRYFGAEVFAEFSNGFIEIPFVSMITGATSAVLMPLFAKLIYDKSDISKITSLWLSALRKSAILIYPIVMYFMFYSKELVIIVYSEAYSASSIYFSIAMILNFFNVIVFAPLLLSLGEVKFYARLHYGLAITAWLVEFLAVTIFKTPVSIAISFVAVSICGMGVSIGYVARRLGISFFDLFPIIKFFQVALHSFISMFAVNFLLRRLIPDVANLPLIMIAGVSYIVILFVLSKWFKINYFEIFNSLFKNNSAKEEGI